MTRVVVAVPTFRRPLSLEACLRSIADQNAVSGEVTVIVVDNDSTPSARAVVERVATNSQLPVVYVHEPTPGISAARNRAVREAGTADLLAFIDDDEVAHEGWLAALVSAQVAHSCDVVVGSVRSAPVAGGPVWVRKSGCFDRPSLTDGQRLSAAATNNVLIRVRPWLEGDAPFDLRFGRTGGEDVEFFRRLHQAGGEIVACPEALVTESVPLDRQRYTWMWRRSFRAGAAYTRIERMHNPARSWWLLRVLAVVRLLLQGVWQIVRYGASPSVAFLRFGTKVSAAGGIVSGLLGHVPDGYGAEVGK